VIEGQLVGLAHEIDPKAAVGLFVGEPEASLKVDMASRGQRVIGPQTCVCVPSRLRELKRTVEQSAAETMTAAVGMDEQNAQLRRAGVVGVCDAEDAPNAPPVNLSDPRRLSLGVAIFGVVSDDLCDQRLKARVPPELSGVDLAVSHHDPAEVAWIPDFPNRDLRFGFSHSHALRPEPTETVVSVA